MSTTVRRELAEEFLSTIRKGQETAPRPRPGPLRGSGGNPAVPGAVVFGRSR